ncbi:extracellular solute-binding protein, partial [Streptomyces vastus]|uniref:extracellular solute-binding protein n=1 Tax=Streptomyces vastus TaxID=285451 RepID=UPI0031D60ED9
PWRTGRPTTDSASHHNARQLGAKARKLELTTKIPTEGKVGFVPFAGKGATLGAEMLAVNAKSTHTTAAWKLIEYLTSKDVQVTRALAAGNPPSVSAAYSAELFKEAPYFKEVEKVAKVAVQRPVSPNYPKVSDQLQTMLSSVVSGLTAPDKALSDAAPKVRDAANV